MKSASNSLVCGFRRKLYNITTQTVDYISHHLPLGTEDVIACWLVRDIHSSGGNDEYGETD
jgi:hypothetical protein